MTSSPAPEEAIRECPLCGSPARLYEDDDQSPLWCCVECTNGSQFGSGSECGMSGPWRKHTADAIAAWNRRAGGEREQQLEAENKRLRAALREIEDAPGSGEDSLADVYHCVNIASAALAGQTEGERNGG